MNVAEPRDGRCCQLRESGFSDTDTKKREPRWPPPVDITVHERVPAQPINCDQNRCGVAHSGHRVGLTDKVAQPTAEDRFIHQLLVDQGLHCRSSVDIIHSLPARHS